MQQELDGDEKKDKLVPALQSSRALPRISTCPAGGWENKTSPTPTPSVRLNARFLVSGLKFRPLDGKKHDVESHDGTTISLFFPFLASPPLAKQTSRPTRSSSAIRSNFVSFVHTPLAPPKLNFSPPN
jgi:hypothetical protein